MYEYHNNIVSIPARLLYEDWGLMSKSKYLKDCQRGKIIRTKDGRGRENDAWVSFYDLDPRHQSIGIKQLGKPSEKLVVNGLEQYIQPDPDAIAFFAKHRTPLDKPLSFEKQQIRVTNCTIFNAIETLLKDPLKNKRFFKNKHQKIWQNISEAVNNLDRKKWNFDLPENYRSLQKRFDKYTSQRYYAFIHAGEGSQNARVVTADIEKFIIGLYCLPNKPYISDVHDMFLQFLGGGIDVYNVETGELFERNDFIDEQGKPIEVSEGSIWNYINKPKNKQIIAKYRNGAYDFNHRNRPHVNRTAPKYSMSKITLDDRDIMHTRLQDGTKVKAYYAFDTLSGAMIGIAHSRNKDHNLFISCIRNMFRFTTRKGFGIPMQMEVEKHLVSDFADGLMKAQNIFPFVRWCNATNSQEKGAERMIEYKKYGVEKENNPNVGRHYARLDSNRLTVQKIFDTENNNYKHPTATFEKIVANELQEQEQYNNELHPNQQKFTGMTRLEVFLYNVNPNLPQYDASLLARFIGEHTPTTIRRNQYVTVQYQKFQLPHPNIIGQLLPNNYEVDAYYLQEGGKINEVYLYQNGIYVCTCAPVPTFNTANAEWTDVDEQGYADAMKYISQFDKMVRQETEDKLQKVGIIENTAKVPIDIAFEEVAAVQELPEPVEYDPLGDVGSYQSQRTRAINDL